MRLEIQTHEILFRIRRSAGERLDDVHVRVQQEQERHQTHRVLREHVENLHDETAVSLLKKQRRANLTQKQPREVFLLFVEIDTEVESTVGGDQVDTLVSNLIDEMINTMHLVQVPDVRVLLVQKYVVLIALLLAYLPKRHSVLRVARLDQQRDSKYLSQLKLVFRFVIYQTLDEATGSLRDVTRRVSVVAIGKDRRVKISQYLPKLEICSTYRFLVAKPEVSLRRAVDELEFIHASFRVVPVVTALDERFLFEHLAFQNGHRVDYMIALFFRE